MSSSKQEGGTSTGQGSTNPPNPPTPLSSLHINLSGLNGAVSSKVLDNYNYNFNSVQNEISDVALQALFLPFISSDPNSMEEDFLSLLTTYYDMTPDRITSVSSHWNR